MQTPSILAAMPGLQFLGSNLAKSFGIIYFMGLLDFDWRASHSSVSNIFLARLVDVDDFMANLWSIHLAVKKEGYVQVIEALFGVRHGQGTDTGLSHCLLVSFAQTIWSTRMPPTPSPSPKLNKSNLTPLPPLLADSLPKFLGFTGKDLAIPNFSFCMA